MNWKPLVASVTFALMAPVMVSGVTNVGVALAAKDTISQKLAKPLTEAQGAINSKDWDGALAALATAKKVEKRSPYENFMIANFEYNAYVGKKQLPQAAKAAQAMIDSGYASPEQVNSMRKAILQIHTNTNNFSAMVDAGQAYLKANPNDLDVMGQIAFAQYKLKQCDAASKTIKQATDAAKASGKAPKETWYQLELTCAVEAQDNAGAVKALENLVRYFPSDDYWNRLLEQQQGAAGGNTDLNIEVYRLKEQTGTMKTAADYIEWAELTQLLQPRLPGEGKRVIDEGFEKGILGGDKQGTDKKHDRMKTLTTTEAAKDLATIAELEPAAKAAPNGDPDAALGDTYASHGQYDKAIEAYERALKKGVKNSAQVQLHLGQAYVKTGNKASATNAFKAVKGDAAYERLAQLWLLAMR
ncbi:tetratricopeptide repeat protein [Iodidimonas sp. SYSU 1G8]|uniref:tetratricopeptide repeat protein n=1 Tax=Iodidimonas sp. SYSU 1G8 TaxID=3133967 RepID=UPI0031FEDFA6